MQKANPTSFHGHQPSHLPCKLDAGAQRAVRNSVSRIDLSQTISLGQSDDSVIAWRRGNVVTVDYRRVKDGFWSGNAGVVTRLGTMPNNLRPRRDIRVPMVGDVYLCVGSDGFVGIFNYGESKQYALGFGACITYCV